MNVNDPIGLANQIEEGILNYSDALKKTKKAYKSLNRFSMKLRCNKYERQQKLCNTYKFIISSKYFF